MTQSTPIPNHEIELLRVATQGVNMPPLAAAAIQAIISWLPKPAFESAASRLWRTLDGAPQRTADECLTGILGHIAMIPGNESREEGLIFIAACAAQWATDGNDGKPVRRDIENSARRRYDLSAPTPGDLAIKAGEAARSVKLGWNPYAGLIELAGQALAWAAKEAEGVN